MAVATYLCEGETIDYTPNAALDAGDVVDLGNFVGIAVTDIAADEQGALYVCGTFDVAKYTSEAISLGDRIYYDAGTETATKTSGYGEATMGVCVKAAGASDATVRVKLVIVPA